jgi:FAD/FMN-containing dehydrogenase
VLALPCGDGWLFAEIGEATAAADRDRGRRRRGGRAMGARVITDSHETAALWQIREDGAGPATRARPAHARGEVAAVPPSELAPIYTSSTTLMSGQGLNGVPHGHFGNGCVHTRVDLHLAAGPTRVDRVGVALPPVSRAANWTAVEPHRRRPLRCA